MADPAMFHHWWSFVLRGVAAILFGLFTFVFPGMALLTLVFLFGAYALLEGAFNIAASMRRSDPGRQPWWVLVVEGVVSVLAGLMAFLVPGLTALALLFLIAGWAIITGALEVAAAVRLRRHIHGEWLLALSGVLSIAFGILAAVFPGAGALSVLLWIGAYAIVFGGTLVALGFKLRKWTRAGAAPPVGGRLATSH